MKNTCTRKISLLGLSLVFVSTVIATPTDTVNRPGVNWHIVPRVQSLGYFAYSGQIGCENPTFDFNLSAEKNNWGFFCFKSFDIQDIHSHNNFLLTMVYRRIGVGNRLTIKPNLGFFVDQSHSLVGKGSDLSFVLTTSYKLNDHWMIDNSAIFPHVLFEPSSADWTNRFRIVYTYNHVELTMLSWHNNMLFDGSTYLSEGASVYYNKIKISDHAFLNTGITGLWMIDSSDEEVHPRKSGLLLTLSISLQ